MANIGELIDGKYEILSEIGRGGMSVVYLAIDKRLNKQWALKEYKKNDDNGLGKVNLESLLHEANIMKKLDHPTLPRIVDIINEKESVFVVMDYIEGVPLDKVLESNGAQPEAAVIEWAKQLSDVLDYLHTQSPPVIYRDLKPGNIMLKPDNTIRLFDFGIAREYKEGQKGDTIALGTRGYAAPEQFGESQTDARTDIYSFGVTLYHLLTGKNPAEPPYEIYPIRHWNPSLSSGLEWMIQKCTQLNPSDRFQSFAEVSYVINNLPKFEDAYKKKQRSRINIFITTSVLTAFFAILAVSFFLGANSIRVNSYESAMALNTIGGFEQAIAVDPDNPEAYLSLVGEIRDNINHIYASPPEGYTADNLPENVMLEEELNKYFSEEQNLSQFKEDNPEAYIEINYELGRLYWNIYEDASGEALVGERKAEVYFERVLTTAEESGIENGGLGDQKYNLAKSYYLVSYFQNQKQNLISQDDGEFEANAAARYAGVYGINDDNTISNPYYSFWVTNKELLMLVSGESGTDVHDKVKFESLKKLAYIINENYSDFYQQTKDKTEKVDASEMAEFFELFDTALDNISESSSIDSEEVTDTRELLNNTIRLVNSLYESDINEI